MRFAYATGLLAVSAIGLTSIAASAQGNWTGTYHYNEALGRDGAGAGNAIFVDHTLTLKPGVCLLEASGYQTDEHIRCKATQSGPGQMQIAFVSFADGKIANQYGVKQYRVGERLLTLSNRGARMITTWQGYKLNDEGAKPGVYFKRSRAAKAR